MTHCEVLDRNQEPLMVQWSFILYLTIIAWFREHGVAKPYSEYEMKFTEDAQFVEPSTGEVVLEVKEGFTFKHWA